MDTININVELSSTSKSLEIRIIEDSLHNVYKIFRLSGCIPFNFEEFYLMHKNNGEMSIYISIDGMIVDIYPTENMVDYIKKNISSFNKIIGHTPRDFNWEQVVKYIEEL